VLERWFTPAYRDVRRYREMLLSIPSEGYARGCEAIRDWDARGELGRISAPTFAIAGAEDPSTPPADLEAIVAEIPGAELRIVGDVRHLVNVERADEFNEAVLAYL
jgi:3-oxoadipate enol-lactonase